MMRAGNNAYLPAPAPIDAYGDGGFRFADMSHVGSLICMPAGVFAWPIKSFDEITKASLEIVLKQANTIDVLLVGTGATQFFLKPDLLQTLRAAGVIAESMATGAAARTYNVLLAEKRSVAAALIAVGEQPQDQ